MGQNNFRRSAWPRMYMNGADLGGWTLGSGLNDCIKFQYHTGNPRRAHTTTITKEKLRMTRISPQPSSTGRVIWLCSPLLAHDAHSNPQPHLMVQVGGWFVHNKSNHASGQRRGRITQLHRVGGYKITPLSPARSDVVITCGAFVR